MKPSLFLEDLYVGQTFGSDTHVMNERDIIAFAAAFDPQPVHVNPQKAKDTFFSGHAASGWHTAAITMRLVVSSVPFDCGIIGMGGELSWRKPVRPNDVLRVKSEILDIRPSDTRPDRGIVTICVKTQNQNNDTVQEFTSKVIVLREKAPCPR